MKLSKSTILSLLFALPSIWFSTQHAAAQETSASAYDPHAVRLLHEMAEAYLRLPALRQETEFVSAVMPAVPLPAPPADPNGAAGTVAPAKGKDLLSSERKLDRKLRLSFLSPNKLRFDVEDKDDGGKVQVSTWVSDGKWFWTFNPEKNLFSREKAPRTIRDFAALTHMTSGSLEILMLMGVDPFARIEDQAEAVRFAGREVVRDIEMDVVIMAADLGAQANETRLYIGANDHLLYRLASQTVQKEKEKQRSGVGSPLDELEPEPRPIVQPDGQNDVPSLPGVRMKTLVTCDNLIEPNPKFDALTFMYEPPAGALYQTNPNVHQKPLTMKQRIAAMNRAAQKNKKKTTPKTIRY